MKTPLERGKASGGVPGPGMAWPILKKEPLHRLMRFVGVLLPMFLLVALCPTLGHAFAIGDGVVLLSQNETVRSTAGGTAVCTNNVAAGGVIIGGPTSAYCGTCSPAGTYTWVDVQWKANYTCSPGWSITDYMTDMGPAATATPTAGTTPTPSMPTPTSPGYSGSYQLLAGTNATLQWNAGSNTATFTMAVYDVTASSWAYYTTVTYQTSYIITLTAGHSYYWEVRGNNGTLSGSYSSPLYFQAPSAGITPTVTPAGALAAPTLSSPGSASSPGTILPSLNPLFSWNAVTNATGYEMQLEDTTISQGYATNAGNATSAYSTYGLNPGDHYFWYVYAKNSNGNSPDSSYLYFIVPTYTPGTSGTSPTPTLTVTPSAGATTPSPTPSRTVTPLPAPVLLSPGAAAQPGTAAAGVSPTFNWQAVTGANNYEINVYSAATGGLIYANASLGAVSSFTLPVALSPGSYYYWRAVAIFVDTPGTYSAPFYFQAPINVTVDPASGFKLYHAVFNVSKGESCILTDYLASAGTVTVRVLDASAHVVRTVSDQEQPQGVFKTTWDGMDDQGRAAPSGTYAIVCEGPEGRRIKRAVLVR